MRALISGGGTGGHVYPALAVAAALPKASEILYVGSSEGMEGELLRQIESRVTFASVSAAAVRGRDPLTLARNVATLWRGVHEAGQLLTKFQPEVIFVTGGYVSVPVGVAAWRQHNPLLVFLPDVVPGLAVSFLARLATRVGTTTPDSARYLPRGKMVVTGYPVRPEFFTAGRVEGRHLLGLPETGPVVLAFGGSRGARSINQAIAAGLDDFLRLADVVHICGRQGDESWLRERAGQLPAELQKRYHLYPYLYTEMPQAMAAADVAISRTGASTLGELPAVGLPAVLVPYPYVHQEENADYLVRHGAAVKVLNVRLRGPAGQPDAAALLDALRPILADDARRAAMAQAARSLARPEAAQALAEQLRQLAEAKGG